MYLPIYQKLILGYFTKNHKN